MKWQSFQYIFKINVDAACVLELAAGKNIIPGGIDIRYWIRKELLCAAQQIPAIDTITAAAHQCLSAFWTGANGTDRDKRCKPVGL